MTAHEGEALELLALWVQMLEGLCVERRGKLDGFYDEGGGSAVEI